MNDEVIVSIIVPVYNEEKYIEKCVNSLLAQNLEQSREIIFVDGGSTDATLKILQGYKEKYPELISVLDNPNKTAPHAMNIGIEHSKGKYIVRIDAHAVYGEDYVSKCIYYLENTDADNVGGRVDTLSEGFIGGAISKMLSSKFGVGGSSFRTEEKSGYVDTVPFGAFRRELIDKIGGFNTQLPRSEDNEFNARIRRNGGKVYLAADICSKYYCRDTVAGILKMGLQNGNALFRTMKIDKSAMSIRHFIPFLFFISLIVQPLLGIALPFFRYTLLLEMGLYLLLDVYFSFLNGESKYGVCLLWLYPLFHIFYGAGSFAGLLGMKFY